MNKLFVPFPKWEKWILRVYIDGNKWGEVELNGSEIDFSLHEFVRACILLEFEWMHPEQIEELYLVTPLGWAMEMLKEKVIDEQRIETQPFLSKIEWELQRIFIS